MSAKIFVVTLVFAPPGPLHSSMLTAVDQNTAIAAATIAAIEIAGDAALAGVAAFEVPPETMRTMLRTAEGRDGPAEVVSLVRSTDVTVDDPEQLCRHGRSHCPVCIFERGIGHSGPLGPFGPPAA